LAEANQHLIAESSRSLKKAHNSFRETSHIAWNLPPAVPSGRQKI